MAKIYLTAQNIDIYEEDGLDPFARTGATSTEQVHQAGAEGVVLGHSEVGDTPQIIRKKLLTIVGKTALSSNGFLKKNTVLVGETWEEFQGNSADVVGQRVSEHLLGILKDVPSDFLSETVVGYEPKWGSRGSGHDDVPPPGSELISTVCKRIRSDLNQAFGQSIGTAVPIIYGGRSTPERTKEILADENVEGLILGSACNTVKKTMDIAEVMQQVRPNSRKVLHANFKAYNLPDSYEEYLHELKTLDNTFLVYLSPCHADLRAIKALL